MAKANGKANGSPDFSPVIETVVLHFEKELADSIAELNEAVQVGEGQASFSCTLQIKRGKKGRFDATLSSRVRAPRAPVQIAMHLEDGQLRLGFDPTVHAEPGDGDAEGEGAEA